MGRMLGGYDKGSSQDNRRADERSARNYLLLGWLMEQVFKSLDGGPIGLARAVEVLVTERAATP